MIGRITECSGKLVCDMIEWYHIVLKPEIYGES